LRRRKKSVHAEDEKVLKTAPGIMRTRMARTNVAAAAIQSCAKTSPMAGSSRTTATTPAATA
jgi:hypothetical protein